MPPLLERILFDYDADLNVNVIKNDDYRIAMQNVRCRNLSSNKPFSRFYWMVGLKANVYIRKTVPDAPFQYHLNSIAKKIRADEFAILKTVALPEDLDSMQLFDKPRTPTEVL